MIEGMKDMVPYEEWACDWKICLKSGQQIGGIGFKGMPNDMGKIEVGYGIEVKYRNQGYATEALGAMLEWAFSQDGVQGVQAQTEDKNTISKKVLIKNGFMEVGVGTEGPLFERKNEKR